MSEDIVHYSVETKTDSVCKKKEPNAQDKNIDFYFLLAFSPTTFDQKQKIRKAGVAATPINY